MGIANAVAAFSLRISDRDELCQFWMSLNPVRHNVSTRAAGQECEAESGWSCFVRCQLSVVSCHCLLTTDN